MTATPSYFHISALPIHTNVRPALPTPPSLQADRPSARASDGFPGLHSWRHPHVQDRSGLKQVEIVDGHLSHVCPRESLVSTQPGSCSPFPQMLLWGLVCDSFLYSLSSSHRDFHSAECPEPSSPHVKNLPLLSFNGYLTYLADYVKNSSDCRKRALWQVSLLCV